MRVAAPADRRFRRARIKPARRKRSWIGHALGVLRVLFGIAFFLVGGYLLSHQVAHARSLPKPPARRCARRRPWCPPTTSSWAKWKLPPRAARPRCAISMR